MVFDLESLKKYEWVGSPPDPWLKHFKEPTKTLYCPDCEEWVVPNDSEILWTHNFFRCTRGEFDKERGAPVSLPVTCPECEEELILKPFGYSGKMGWYWWRHSLMPYNKMLGVSAKFFNILAEKINSGKSVQAIFSGRAGTGKTYFMIKIAQILNPFTSIKEIIFTRDEFINLVNTAEPKTVLCVDETSYIGGKRSWQNPQQQQIMLIWESMRFKLLPVFSTVINISLLDKTLREQLIVFQITLIERGMARVYSINPHPLQNYVGRKRIQTLYLKPPDWNFCQKPSCLLPKCSYIDTCPLLRGQYEKKKRDIQAQRYKIAEEDATIATKTLIDWVEDFLLVEDACYVTSTSGTKRKLNVELIELEVGCSGTMARRIRSIASKRSTEQLEAYIEKAKKKRDSGL